MGKFAQIKITNRNDNNVDKRKRKHYSNDPGGEIPNVIGSNRRFSWQAMEYKL